MPKWTTMVLLLASFAACATKVADTAPSSFSSVDPKLVVRELGPVDLGRLCIDVQVFGATALTDDEVRGHACVAEAVNDGFAGGVAPNLCHECLSGCLANGSSLCGSARTPSRQPIDFGACRDFYQAAISCQLTVGELGDCLTAAAGYDATLAQRGESVCDGDAGAPTQQLGTHLIECASKCSGLLLYGLSIVEGKPLP